MNVVIRQRVIIVVWRSFYFASNILWKLRVLRFGRYVCESYWFVQMDKEILLMGWRAESSSVLEARSSFQIDANR